MDRLENKFVASNFKQNKKMLHSNLIGNKIATARKMANLSQAELAQQISISPQAVGKWERGESVPDITTLNKLAQIFGVDLNYFSEGFPTSEPLLTPTDEQQLKNSETEPKKRFDWNWDMSEGNWVDADFSGLKDLKNPPCRKIQLENSEKLFRESQAWEISSFFLGSDPTAQARDRLQGLRTIPKN